MRSVSGVRGIVGQGLLPNGVVDHVRAFLEITGAKSVVIGRDSRPTGPQIEELVSATCRLAGCEAIILGLATTPTVELMVTQLKAGGGIIVTSSHNPVEWNALKFLGPDGMFLGPDAVKRLFALVDAGNLPWPGYQAAAGRRNHTGADEEHVKATLAMPGLNVERIRSRKFRIALDGVNGAGSYVLPMLLRELGCEVRAIHCSPDGTFPRGAEPTPENLVDLSNEVLQHKCAAGFALDPDADRLALVGSDGKAMGEEYTLAIACDALFLNGLKGDLCANLSTSRMFVDVAEAHGQKAWRSAVGEINVSLEMAARHCLVGGEGNGGVIYPGLHSGRDSLVAAALVLDWMAREGQPPERWAATHPRYEMVKHKLPLPAGLDAQSLYGKLESRYQGWTIDRRDGFWIGKGKSWAHLRASNTEPILRVIAEAPTQKETDELVQQLTAAVEK